MGMLIYAPIDSALVIVRAGDPVTYKDDSTVVLSDAAGPVAAVPAARATVAKEDGWVRDYEVVFDTADERVLPGGGLPVDFLHCGPIGPAMGCGPGEPMTGRPFFGTCCAT